MKGLLSKTIFKVGTQLRNPSLKRHLDFLKESQYWSYDQLCDYQNERCRELLIFAGKYSKFYKDKFLNEEFDPKAFRTVEDLKQLKPITKSDLLSFNAQIHTDFNFKKKFFAETSGTSGEVLKFYKDEEWDSKNRASWMRGYSWYDVNPWDKNGYFWGFSFNTKARLKTALLDSLQNRFRLFSYNNQEVDAFLKKLKSAKFLHGYSSMIYEVALRAKALGYGPHDFQLRMIKGTSEKIYPAYQPAVMEAFGQPIISEYGAAESGIIAYECKHGKMHISMENIVVEEEEGEILTTNLVGYSFPIIRYKLGDYVTLSKGVECACGMRHDVVENIEGRVGKRILGRSETFPSLTLYYIFKTLALDHGIDLTYKGVQNEKGQLELKIAQQLKGDERLLVEKVAGQYFNNDLALQIIDNIELRESGKKLKDFESHL